jgi:FkbM family methyltransferase
MKLSTLLPARVVTVLYAIRAALHGEYEPAAAISYSQEGEDMVLASLFFRRIERGFFVDVGAHHPSRFSNTYRFYRRGWRGINIDPNPGAIDLFDRQRPRDVNLALGVSSDAGALTYYMFDEPAVNTLSERQARAVEAAGEFRLIGTRTVQVKRLESILDEHLPPNTSIDLLSVDVEGLDMEVLASNDWTRFAPKCIAVEAYNETAESLLASPLNAFLRERGYELRAKTVNTVIYTNAAYAALQATGANVATEAGKEG